MAESGSRTIREGHLKTPTLQAILTDVHFWVPVVVLILGCWLLVIFVVTP